MAHRSESTARKNILVAVLSAFLFFTLLEISLRILQVFNPSFPVIPDMTYLRYRGRPKAGEFNGFILNSRGFKDTEFSVNKSPGTFRILSLGDSQTYGAVPYPDSYMTIVEKKLQIACPRCELLNMGIPSAGPVDYLSVLLNEGIDLHPDMVLVNFNIYDDFKNGGKRFKLYSYSAAASFINYILTSLHEPEGRMFGVGMYREGITLRSDESYVRLVINAHANNFKKNNPAFSRDFQSSFSYIEKIKKVCDSKKIILAVVIIPADLQLYSHLQQKVMIALHGRNEDYDYRIPNRMLSGELRRLRIPHRDILDTFLNTYATNGKSLTQGNDPHWNRYGSMIAAEAVSPWLIRQVAYHTRLKNQN